MRVQSYTYMNIMKNIYQYVFIFFIYIYYI